MRITKPFKGNVGYEWQIGSLVIIVETWGHHRKYPQRSRFDSRDKYGNWALVVGRLHLFNDQYSGGGPDGR